MSHLDWALIPSSAGMTQLPLNSYPSGLSKTRYSSTQNCDSRKKCAPTYFYVTKEGLISYKPWYEIIFTCISFSKLPLG